MSATAALDGRVRYKDRLQPNGLRTAADWMKTVVARANVALRAEPRMVDRADEAARARPGYYGVFY